MRLHRKREFHRNEETRITTQSVGYLFAGIASYLLVHVPRRRREWQWTKRKGNFN